MNLGKGLKILGWAVAYYVGGGLLFLLCAGFILIATGLLWPAEVLFGLFLGTPLLFSFVAVYHGFTGRWARVNYYLRQWSVTVLWVSVFYLGTLALAALCPYLPGGKSLYPLMILVSIPAGGLAGSLCWRGKLPGSWKESLSGNPPAGAGDESHAVPHVGDPRPSS